MSIDGEGSPQLTDDGAKLLADVLAKRANDRHNTLSSQRNARRREADRLRQTPERGDPEHGAPETGADEAVESELNAEYQVLYGHETDANDGAPIRWVVLIAVGLAIGVCIVLIASLGSGSGEGSVEAVESTADEPVDQVDSIDVSENSEAGRQVAQGSAPEGVVDPEDIVVTVYDTAPSQDGVYSFALRLKSVSTSEELATDDFTVRVEDEFGVAATTFSRFVHATLPTNSSALATVRAEEAGPGPQFVVVWYGNTAIARILIESGS